MAVTVIVSMVVVASVAVAMIVGEGWFPPLERGAGTAGEKAATEGDDHYTGSDAQPDVDLFRWEEVGGEQGQQPQGNNAGGVGNRYRETQQDRMGRRS